MSKTVIALLLCLLFMGHVCAQGKGEERVCADVPGQTFGTYRFRRVGETIEIALRDPTLNESEVKASGRPSPSPGDNLSAIGPEVECEPVSLELHWTNGHNNGSNFNVTFRDNNNRLIWTKQISAFMTGVLEFPVSSLAAQPVYGSLSLVAVPSVITIQAVQPFAAPASLSYRITRIARAVKQRDKKDDSDAGKMVKDQIRESGGQGNEIVSIKNAVRLIGASRLPLVQIELRTNRPFPLRDVPLQLQIGNRVFLDELSGDHTGRKLTLSLTPEMFAALQDGDEIVAFFGKRGAGDHEVWSFGKLSKGSRQ